MSDVKKITMGVTLPMSVVIMAKWDEEKEEVVIEHVQLSPFQQPMTPQNLYESFTEEDWQEIERVLLDG